MLRPLAIAQTNRSSRSRRLAALAAAGVIEAGLVAALLSGLATRVVKQLPHELHLVEIATPPETIPPVKPELVQPEVPTVAMPEVRIQRPVTARTITAVATPHPVAVSRIDTTAIAVPAPVAPTPPQSVSGTHTTPPYPDMARRLSEHGKVQLHIAIAADGQVTNVTVVSSSGSERLDEAARSWILANWRYKAATQNGLGITSETDALVVFDLKNAR